MRKVWLCLGLVFVLCGSSGLLFVGGCSNNPVSESTAETTGQEMLLQEMPPETGETSSGDAAQEQIPEDKADGGQEQPQGAESQPEPEDGPEPNPTEPNPNVGKIRWSTSVQGEIRSVALSLDEKALYVAAKGLSARSTENGSELWSLGTLGTELSDPVVGDDGTIYLSNKEQTLYAVDPKTKTIAWNAKLTAEAQKFAPALGKDGMVLVAAGNAVHALKSPGNSVWSANYIIGNGVSSSPAVGPDGTIYVCGSDQSLHAIKPTGEKLWEKSLGGQEACRYISIDADGTVFVGGSKLHAYSKDGTAKFTPQTQYGVVNTAVVIHQSFLYFGTFRGKLFKVNKSDGEPSNILWKEGVTISVNDELRYAPTVGAGGLVYIASVDSSNPEIQFINPTRGQVERSFGTREPFSGHPAIAKDGTLFVGTTGGTLIAIWTDSLGLANSPWPRGLANNQNTSYLK